MALWGTQTSKPVTGTVKVTKNSNEVVGDGTSFTTELASGQTLIIKDVPHKIAAIQDDTNLTLVNEFADTGGAALTVTASEMPAYVPDAERLDIVGLNPAESQDSVNVDKGINTPGWGKYTTYVDAQGNTRHKFESLVAGKFVNPTNPPVVPPTPVITIDLQPEASTEVAGTAVEFIVVASVVPAGTLTYQWESSGDGVSFTEMDGETSDTLTIADNTGLDGTEYRVVVSSSGAVSVTSGAALLTESA